MDTTDSGLSAPDEADKVLSKGAAEIGKLDDETASLLRKEQVITKVVDVVRELVENSVDSGALSVQVLLEQYGLHKIEIRDNGEGISKESLNLVIQGGYTSKLEDTGHLSLQHHYGFRGEALASICSVALVAITTRTSGETCATKYVLNSRGQVAAASSAAYGKGTIVAVEKLFHNLPVRRMWAADKGRSAAELKEIENFLKGLAIANPSVHIRLHHNSNLIWNKAAVSCREQALMTVLGHGIAKGLGKVERVEEDGRVEVEGFFVKKPVNMKNFSFTSNKMTFFFVNRKRVYVREFEKVLQKHTVAAIEKPAPADRRRFPVAVVSITVPFEDVDFNRDVDKTKVFLVQKERIREILEEMLQAFYDLTPEDVEKANDSFTVSASPKKRKGKSDDDAANKKTESPSKMKIVNDIFTSPVKEKREDVVRDFMQDIPVVSTGNFCGGGTVTAKVGQQAENDQVKTLKVIIPMPTPPGSSAPASDPNDNNLTVIFTAPSDSVCTEPCVFDFALIQADPNASPATTTSSFFDFGMDQFLKDNSTARPGDNQSMNLGGVGNGTNPDMDPNTYGQCLISGNEVYYPTPIRTRQDGGTIVTDSMQPPPASSPGGFNLQDLLRGKIYGKSGNLISGTNLVKPVDDPKNLLADAVSPQPQINLNSAYERVRSGFMTPGPPPSARTSKRPRLSSTPSPSSKGGYNSELGVALSGCAKQVTLDRFAVPSTPKPNTPSPSLSLSGSRLTCITNTNTTPRKDVHISEKWGQFFSNPARVGSRSGNIMSPVYSATPAYRKNANLADENRPEIKGELIGKIVNEEDSHQHDLYTARINGVLGVFDPLNMLFEFPALKYDLRISLQKSPNSPEDSINAIYTVNGDCVPKLFEAFLTRVSPNLSSHPKVFHHLLDLKKFNENSSAAGLSLPQFL